MFSLYLRKGDVPCSGRSQETAGGTLRGHGGFAADRSGNLRKPLCAPNCPSWGRPLAAKMSEKLRLDLQAALTEGKKVKCE